MKPILTATKNSRYSITLDSNGVATVNRESATNTYLCVAVPKKSSQPLSQPLLINSINTSLPTDKANQVLSWLASKGQPCGDWTILESAAIPSGITVKPVWGMGWSYKLYRGSECLGTLSKRSNRWSIQVTRNGAPYRFDSLQAALNSVDCGFDSKVAIAA